MGIQIWLQHPDDPTKKRRVGEVTADRTTNTFEVKRYNTLILRNVWCPLHQKKGECPALSITESCIIDAQKKGATVVKFYVDFGESGKSTYVTSINTMLKASDGTDDWGLNQKQVQIHDLVKLE